MKTKNYTYKFINKNFLIKVAGIDPSGNKINSLVGVSGCLALIGEDLLEKFVGRALKKKGDVCVCKLRRGLKVSLYAH